jgi:hypothetical protein
MARMTSWPCRISASRHLRPSSADASLIRTRAIDRTHPNKEGQLDTLVGCVSTHSAIWNASCSAPARPGFRLMSLLKEASKHHLQARFVLRIVVNDQNISAHIRGIGEWLALPL